jgi:hypothetical protein
VSSVNVEDLLSAIVDSTRCELDILADLGSEVQRYRIRR